MFGLFQKDDGVRKCDAEMSARRRIKFAEALRVRADFVKQSFHLAIKAHAQVRRNLRIITDRSGEFLVCFGMKQVLHRPAILRARASDSSSGTPSIFPASI